MQANRWKRVEQVFNETVVIPFDERFSFVERACGADDDLRFEVISLLEADESTDEALNQSVFPMVAQLLEEDFGEMLENSDFAAYKLKKLLGRGGMGAVFLAEDARLGRLAAVKILPPSLAADPHSLARFRREARAASALSHPNIAHIYEFGESADGRPFLAMEYVEGTTLRELIKAKNIGVSLALNIAGQIADALASTHERGIVHLDIKPENIMLRPDSFVKILDFGLAKLVARKSIGFENAAFKQNNTAKGLIMGTLKYMSPEQAKGEQVDERTDIFSLGVVIYETIAGVTPFAGDSPSETFANLVNAAPTPISLFAENIPDKLECMISKMLRKNKEERYQTMNDVLTDLKSLRENPSFDKRLKKSSIPDDERSAKILPATTRNANRHVAQTIYSFARQNKQRKSLAALALFVLLTAVGFGFRHFITSSGSTNQIESVAVLPFENQNPNTEYLSDGLTESVINSLSGLPNLSVISRNSVFQYKGKETDLMTIGRELNTRTVLTGRFVERGDDLIVSVALTDLRDNKQIWGRQYNRRTSDAFALQQEIARDISDVLRSKLSGEEKMRLAKSETDSPEAFELYLKGRYQWNKRTGESFQKAVDFFNQAIEKDPTYALAYVGLANCYLSVNYTYVITREERVAMVKAAAKKALEIDPKLGGEVHAVLAINSHFNEWDWANAEREYKLAVESSPNYATAHHWYAEFLATEGRFDESFAEYQRALELDPLSLAVKTDLGLNYYYARQFDRAAEYLKKLKESDPNYMRTHVFLAMVYNKKEMFEEAIAEDDRANTLGGSDLQMLAARKTELENAFKIAGAKGYWRKALDLEFDLNGGKSNSVVKAKIYSELGERDKAFELLEKGCTERSPLLVWLKVSPEFDGIRSDSRFTNLMRRVGLPQ